MTFAKRLFAAIGANHLQSYAQSLAFGAVFALLPGIALLVLLLGVFGAVDLVLRAMEQLGDALPADVIDLLRERLLAAARTEDSGAFGVGALVSALVALWGASGAVRSLMNALNVVNGCEEDRGFLPRTLLSLALAIGAVALVACALVVIVVGGSVADQVFSVIGFGEDAARVWGYLRWPVLVVLLWLGVATVLRLGPSTRRADTGGVFTAGTLVATLGWVAFSAAFSWYVGFAGSYGAAWGAVAGIVVLLLYLQYVALIILVGAQIDVLRADDGAGQVGGRVRRALRELRTSR